MQLKSGRLYLRFYRKGEAEKLFAAIEESRKELLRFTVVGHYVKSVADEVQFIEDSRKLRKERKSFSFGIFDLRSQTLLGSIGLHGTNSRNHSGEIGYWIRTSQAGQGIASESAALILKFGFGELKLHRIVLRAMTDNHASIRIAEKLGFTYEGIQRDEMLRDKRWVDFKRYSMLESEFRKLEPKIKKLISR
jgi:RimJ/RimL family protein N-acetyltransferase